MISRRVRVTYSAYPARDELFAVCRTSRGVSEFVGADRLWVRNPQNVGQPFTLEQAEQIASEENEQEAE
jgi:hypothetical protein